MCAGAVPLVALSEVRAEPGKGATRCEGLKATITSSNAEITGTDNNDVIVVTGTGPHTVYGLLGNDRVCGSTGADTIYGGGGNDRILGDGGADKIYGDAGNDVLLGGVDADVLSGGLGEDVMSGGAGDDRPLAVDQARVGAVAEPLRGEQAGQRVVPFHVSSAARSAGSRPAPAATPRSPARTGPRALRRAAGRRRCRCRR